MDEEKRRSLLESCREASRLLEEIHPVIVPWALANGDLPDRLADAVSRIRDMAKQIPKEWVPMNGAQVAIASVLCDPGRLEEFTTHAQGRLSDAAAGLLRMFQERAAFLTAFTSVEALGDDLFSIRDESSGKKIVLESPSLAEVSRNPAWLYFTLLFWNGACFQATGPLHYYRGIDHVDLHYYASLVDADLYARAGLSAVMSTFPERFIILDAFSEIPSIGHRGERLYACTTTIEDVRIDPSALSEAFDIEEAGDTIRLRLKGSEPPLAAADVYWKPAERRAFIHTSGLEGHRRIAAALAGSVEVPPEPRLAISVNMEVIASKTLGVEPAVAAWERPFEPPPPTAEQEAELGRMNALLGDLVEATNHGRSYDLANLAARHRVSLEIAREAERILRRKDDSMAIDIDGGLPGVPVPPPSERVKYHDPLGDCGVFRFSTGEEAQRLFAELRDRIEALRPGARVSRTRTLLALPTLPTVLEEIDDRKDDPSGYLLKHTLYLLCHAGGEYHGSDDYAAEVLRLFWQVVPGSKERADLRRFVRQYSIWCREVLVRSGLAEAEPADGGGDALPVKPGAPFRLRASAFFRAWAGLRKRR